MQQKAKAADRVLRIIVINGQQDDPVADERLSGAGGDR